ncbi:MAG TPA: hypothetical protein VMK05_11305 [Burkholderiales bacterium]|nr:hypothetical protein [Burkholderiales bacterium]
MIRIAQLDNSLVLSYPGWAAVIFFAYALAALALALSAPAAPWRRRLCAPLAAFFVWLGLYFWSYEVQLTGQSARVYGLLGQGAEVRWNRVRAVAVGDGGGVLRKTRHIMITDAEGTELDLALTDLNRDQRRQLASFITARVAPSAFVPDRESWLLKIEQSAAR